MAKADNPHKYELAKVINVDNTKNTIKIYFKDLKQTKYDGVYKIKEKESTESITRMINGLEIELTWPGNCCIAEVIVHCCDCLWQ